MKGICEDEDKNFRFIIDKIKKNGYIITKQKKLVLAALYQSEEHLSAEEIFDQLDGFNIGLATVYRALKLYSTLGIIKEVKINDTNYYEMDMFSKKPLHIHFQCERCNRILDVDDEKLNIGIIRINNQFQEENELEVNNIDILFKGICEECRKIKEDAQD